MRRTRRQRWKRGVRAAAVRFWDVSVVGGGRVVFFYAQDAAAGSAVFYARDAAAEVEERSAGGGGAVFGGAMVGRLWGVWREVVLELALTPLAFFLWGMLCIALL